jgi:hypothetical protein
MVSVTTNETNTTTQPSSYPIDNDQTTPMVIANNSTPESSSNNEGHIAPMDTATNNSLTEATPSASSFPLPTCQGTSSLKPELVNVHTIWVDNAINYLRNITLQDDSLTIKVHNIPDPIPNTFKTVSFQVPEAQGTPGPRPQRERVPIPAGAEETWKLTRRHLSNAVKANVRADHLSFLARNQLIPSWTLGAAELPGFILPLIEQLSSLKHMQALETLNSMAEKLRETAVTSQQLGNAQRMVLKQLYGAKEQDFISSATRIEELVIRDEAECKQTMHKRADNLRAAPITMTMVQEFLTDQSNIYTTFGNQSNQNQATQGSENQQAQARASNSSTSNSRPARPRGRGRGYSNRGNRGSRSRGSSRGRGRGNRPRSRSNSRTRTDNRNQGGLDTSRLSPDEIRVLNAYRQSKM